MNPTPPKSLRYPREAYLHILGMELANANDFDSADHATAEQAYALATKLLITLADPAEVAALHQKESQLRKAIDERVQTTSA